VEPSAGLSKPDTLPGYWIRLLPHAR